MCSLAGGPAPKEDEFPEDVQVEGFWDDVNGGWLPEKLVKAARHEELEWIHRREVYREVDEQECFKVTGKPPISLRWVDTNKGSLAQPHIRSRLAARELKCRTPELTAAELFSAMPPVEALKSLASLLVSQKYSKRGGLLKLRFYDISRARFYGKPKRPVYVNLPDEEKKEGMCGYLEKTMYGTRDASNAWQSDYTELLEEESFVGGVASPAIFYSEAQDLRILIHGDDFGVLGDDEAQDFMEATLGKRYDYKCTGRLGAGGADGSECIFLSRVIRYQGPAEEPTIEIEADQRHVEVALESLWLTGSKAVATPSIKTRLDEVEAEQNLPALGAEQSTLFRSVLMRISYVAQDRPDVAEAVKCLSRRMVAPSSADFQRLKRLARYLAGKPRAVIVFRPQSLPTTLRVEVDSDHAGDLVTRRSTTGMVCMFGEHCVKTQSSLQSTVSLSSGESEYYAAVQGAAVGLGVRAPLDDWRVPVRVTIVIATDSTAALGFASRRGLGKLRHVSTRYLWLQERVARKEVHIVKVHTSVNRADVLTKPTAAPRASLLLGDMGIEFRTGRASSAKGTLMNETPV